MSQFPALEDTADRAERGKRLNFHISQPPSDGLITAEVTLVIQVQSNQLHDLFNLRRGAVRLESGRRD
jgi:hypothetical protein